MLSQIRLCVSLSVCLLSIYSSTQPVEIFNSISTPFSTLVIR